MVVKLKNVLVQVSLLFKQQDGYSMIEIMTAVIIIAILSLASINLFLTTSIGSSKDNTIREIKLDGEFVISQLESDLRAARRIVPNQDDEVCEESMSSLSLENFDGTVSEWYVDNGQLVRDGQTLVSDKVQMSTSGFQISCRIDPGTRTAYVTVAFALRSASSDESLEVPFQAEVSLRNKQ